MPVPPARYTAMTFISVGIMKTEETKEWVKYAFGYPPKRVLGNVAINKSNGRIELIDIVDEKYKRSVLPYVLKHLSDHYQRGDFPEHTYYNA